MPTVNDLYQCLLPSGLGSDGASKGQYCCCGSTAGEISAVRAQEQPSIEVASCAVSSASPSGPKAQRECSDCADQGAASSVRVLYHIADS